MLIPADTDDILCFVLDHLAIIPYHRMFIIILNQLQCFRISHRSLSDRFLGVDDEKID